MKIVYLDQNVASELAKSQSGSIWWEIRELLVTCFNHKQCICPMPEETFIESSACLTETRVQIDEFFACVSGGLIFKSFFKILNAETIRLVRPAFKFEFCDMYPMSWGHHDTTAQTANNTWNQCKARMKKRMEQYFPSEGVEKMCIKEIFGCLAQERAGLLLRDLERFIENPARPLADFEDNYLMKFLADNSLTAAEANELYTCVRNHKLGTIRVNFFDMLLGAAWEHDHLHTNKKYKPNDEMDRWRAAVALSHSDVFITDAYVVQLCRHAKTQEYSDTRVFSIKDTNKLVADLHAIINS